MELYTLDGLLRRTELIEGFESFLWADRYAGIGDIQIIIASTQQNRNLLASGTLLGLSESKTVMKIETIVDKEDDEGRKLLTITGRELKNIFGDRVALTGTLGDKPGTWAATGKPSDVIRELVDYTIRSGSSDPTDIIPLLIPGSLYDPGNLPEEEDEYRIQRPFSSLLDAVQELASIWDLGIRLYKGEDDGTLYFDVYKGNDRTTNQNDLPPVIFSPDLDSLQNVSELTSVANSKNVAYVYNDEMTIIVYAAEASDTTEGLAKRTLFVDGTSESFLPRSYDLTDLQASALRKAQRETTTTQAQYDALAKVLAKERFASGEAAVAESVNSNVGTTLTTLEKGYITAAIAVSVDAEGDEWDILESTLIQKGKEELAKNRSISAFDGEITQLSPYKYGRDYELGDLVEMRNADGLTNQMLVIEQIFAADESGERAYPTLAIKQFITPGSWLAWESNQVWQDAPGVWADA